MRQVVSSDEGDGSNVLDLGSEMRNRAFVIILFVVGPYAFEWFDAAGRTGWPVADRGGRHGVRMLLNKHIRVAGGPAVATAAAWDHPNFFSSQGAGWTSGTGNLWHASGWSVEEFKAGA